MDGPPEGLTLSRTRSGLVGQHVTGGEDDRSGGAGHQRGVVGGSIVDDDDLVDQAAPVDQLVDQGRDHASDGGRLVAGG